MPSKEAKKLFKGIKYNYPTYDAGGRVKTYYDDGGKLPVDAGAIETPEDDTKWTKDELPPKKKVAKKKKSSKFWKNIKEQAKKKAEEIRLKEKVKEVPAMAEPGDPGYVGPEEDTEEV